MKPVISHASALVVGEVIGNVAVMVKEIAQYKRAIVELSLQREQMQQQAKLAHLQIKMQLTCEIKRIKSISQGFTQTLQQNALLVQCHAQCEQRNQQLCIQLLQMMNNKDAAQMQVLQLMWKDLITQTELNRQESARLQQQLMDANQQFGISISQRDLAWQTVS